MDFSLVYVIMHNPLIKFLKYISKNNKTIRSLLGQINFVVMNSNKLCVSFTRIAVAWKNLTILLMMIYH